MTHQKTGLHQRIESGQAILLAEVSPPQGADPAPMRDLARCFRGKVHGLGICDNRERVAMSALASASLAAAEGIEPVLHIVTRDRNRVALISECLGAMALGIRNILCTSGTHQTLGQFRAARNVFDLDAIQLIHIYTDLANNASVVGEVSLNGGGPLCLGGVAAPFADPLELQVMRLAKKASAGAQFLITQPVFDLDRFTAWWSEIERRGVPGRVAVVAGIHPLTSAEEAQALATRRPLPGMPESVLSRITSAQGAPAQRAAGIELAVETIQRLSKVQGLRGFEIAVGKDVDAVLEVIEKSGLKV